MLLNPRYCCYSYSSFAVKYKNTFEIEPAVSSSIGHLWNCRSVLLLSLVAVSICICCRITCAFGCLGALSLSLSLYLYLSLYLFTFIFSFTFTVVVVVVVVVVVANFVNGVQVSGLLWFSVSRSEIKQSNDQLNYKKTHVSTWLGVG